MSPSDKWPASANDAIGNVLAKAAAFRQSIIPATALDPWP